MNYDDLKDSLFVKRLRDYLNEEQIKLILIEIDNICTYCWNDNSGCYCSNDD